MATYGQTITIPGLLAAADLSSAQYHVMKFASTAGQIKTASAKTSTGIGVLQNDPASGEMASLAVLGISKAVASGSISAGAFLGWNTTGRVRSVTADNTGVFGFANEAATTNGDIIQITITGFQRH